MSFSDGSLHLMGDANSMIKASAKAIRGAVSEVFEMSDLRSSIQRTAISSVSHTSSRANATGK